jgi:ReqiPepy6 Gp37-like protein
VDLYTLTDTFLAKDVVDEYVSAIWTERYTSAGDTQLVVPATMQNIETLAPGAFLALRGSNEVMILETQDIQDELMTVSGRTLVTFLNTRLCWFSNPDWISDGSKGPRIVDYTDKTRVPGDFIANVVYKSVITPTHLSGSFAQADIDFDNDKIARLTLGAVDTSGAVKRLTAVAGPLYDSIQTVAEQEKVGITLYLASADPIAGYSLKFSTYQGKNRTSGQSTYPLVRLTPDLDSFGDIKELHSIGIYRNVCYVYYQETITEHWLDPTGPEPEGFDRRVMVTVPQDEPVGRTLIQSFGGPRGYTFSQYVVSAADIAAFRAQAAKDALANNNYVHAIDGQASPISEFKYGTDYLLGDIIELEGITGLITQARVTEYIRSQDKNGAREYPTISVI